MQLAKFQKKTFICLHDYVQGQKVRKRLPYQFCSIQDKTKPKDIQSQKEFGLETLLHFNDSINLSTIASKRQCHPTSQQDRYGDILDLAQIEMDSLKSKRLNLEQEWKRKKSWRDEKEIDSSVVSAYKLIGPLESMSKLNPKQDIFILEIKNNIAEYKAKFLSRAIKKTYIHLFIYELTRYDCLLSFFRKRENLVKKMAFLSWLQYSFQRFERGKLRNAIVSRIKNRRILIKNAIRQKNTEQ